MSFSPIRFRNPKNPDGPDSGRPTMPAAPDQAQVLNRLAGLKSDPSRPRRWPQAAESSGRGPGLASPAPSASARFAPAGRGPGLVGKPVGQPRARSFGRGSNPIGSQSLKALGAGPQSFPEGRLLRATSVRVFAGSSYALFKAARGPGRASRAPLIVHPVLPGREGSRHRWETGGPAEGRSAATPSVPSRPCAVRGPSSP